MKDFNDDKKKKGPLSFTEWVKKLWAPILGLISAITAVIQFFQLWQGDQKTFTQVFLTVGVLLFLASLYYVGFTTTKSPIVISDEWGNRKIREKYLYDRWAGSARIFFVLSIIGILVGWGAIIRRTVEEEKNKVIVLVADFVGPSPEKYAVTETVLEQLKQATADNTNIEIRALGKPISVQEGDAIATYDGLQNHASIVIWGWYAVTDEKVNLNIHFNMLKSNTQFFGDPNFNTRIEDANLLESFSLQIRLGEELSYFVLFARGFAEFKAGDEAQAKLYLGKALQYADSVQDKGSVFWAYIFHSTLVLNENSTACWPNCTADDYKKSLSDLDAAVAISRLSEEKADDLLPLTFRGFTYIKAGMYPQAITDFNETISIYQTYFPSNPSVYDVDYFYRGWAHLLNDDYIQAIDDLTQNIKNDKPSALALGLRGDAYQNNNQCDLAINDYVAAINLKDEFDSLDEEYKGNTYWGLVLCLGNVGEYDKAIQLLQKSNANYPQIPTIQIGAMEIRQKHYQEALSQFDKALLVDPKNVFALYHRGVVYYEQEQYQNAIDEFNRALDIDPNDLPSLNGRALSYYKLGKEQQSLADFDKAIAIDPNYPNAGIRIGYQVTHDKADDVEYDGDVILFLINNNRWQPGIVVTNNMLKNAKNDKDKASLLGARGWIYYEGRQYNEAISDLNNAIVLDDTLADAYLYRAESYIALNINSPQAIEDLNNYLVLNPNSPEKDNVLKLISQLQANKAQP